VSVEVWAGDDRPLRCGEVVLSTVALEPGLAAAVAVVAGPTDTVDIAAVAQLAE
jgi:hypothetical protein